MRFLIGLIVIVVLAAGGWYFFLAPPGGGDGASITFQGPDKVYLGVPFDLNIGVNNGSGVLWRDVRLSLFFNQNLITKNLGTLGEGSLTSVPLELVAIAASEQQAEVTVSYLPEGVDSRFEKKESWALPLLEPAVKLEIGASEKIISGQELELKIDYKNVSQDDLDNLFLKIDYPGGFNFKKASLEPETGDNLWDLGGLRKNSEGKLSVFGNLATTEKESEFKIAILLEIRGTKEVISEERVKLVIEESPLAVAIILNETESYIARLGDNLNYAIGYQLAETVKKSEIKSALIKARLVGSMFDLTSLKINEGGAIKLGTNEIIWHLASVDLVEGSGSVTFSINTKSDYAIRRLSDRNFTLKIEAEAEAGKLSNRAELETKIAGQMKVETKALFYDADSGILNKPGQYTIHWFLSNTATDVKEVVVRAALAPAVTFTGIAKSNVDSNPSYNPETLSMVWKINRISAGSGLFGKPLEGIFQIQVPAGAAAPWPLLGETTVSAIDDFTGATLTNSYHALTTGDVPQQ